VGLSIQGRVSFPLAVLVLVATASSAWAQAGTASVYGDIKDQQGAALPGAAVTLTSTDTGATRATVTNETGAYRFVALTPGNYSLKVELTGFRTGLTDKLQLPVDTATKFDVVLQLGSLTETVEVASTSPILNTTDASLGNVISGIQIQQLPLEARNPVGLLSLQAGAVYLPSGDQRSGSVSGARSDQSNVTLDGVDVNDPQWGYAYNSVIRVTLESLQEFRVSTSNYSADMGRSSAAQVSLVTKSGTNRFSGAGYGSHRNTNWSSNEYFSKLTQLQSGLPSKAPKLDKRNLGGALGGPIKRDRLFFFGNYEGLRESSEDPVLRNVPSSTLRDGVLVYVCGVPAACPGGTVRGFANNHSIPAGRYGLSPSEVAGLDPLGIGPSRAVADHFKKYPLPNDPGRDGINYMGYRFSAPIENEFNTYITRFDYLIDRGGNHKLFGRTGTQDDTINSVPQFEGQAPTSKQVNKNWGYAVGYDAVLSSNLVNTFRYGLSKIDEVSAGLRTADAVTFRFITDLDALTSTNGREVPTHNIVNDMSWLKGNHNVKFGANLRFTRAPKYSNASSFHTGNLNPSWVAGTGRNYMPGSTSCSNPLCTQLPAVASTFASGYGDPWLTLLGVISQPTANYNYDKTGTALPNGEPVRRTYATDEYEFYVQDSWRLRPNLTVTAGVRYNLYSPPWEVDGLQLTPSVPLGEWFEQRRSNMLRGIGDNALPPLTLDLAGPANGKKGFYDWDYDNFGPRVAAAWTPHANGGLLGWLTGGDKMVVRGGYSLLYDRVGFALATIFDEGGSFGMSTSLSSTFGTSDETVPSARFKDLSTLPPTLPGPPPGGFPATPPLGNVAIYQSIDDGITTPYHHVFNAVVGRELKNGFAIEAAYVGRRGRDLLIRRDLAMPMDIVDPKSGVNYFTAAQQLINAYRQAGINSAAPASFLGIGPIPYWENMFPGAAGVVTASGQTVTMTATQRMARLYFQNNLDWITGLFNADTACNPACSALGRYAFFNSQFSQLRAQSSMASADYNSLQLTMRKRWTDGYQFDVNYTLSKSTDLGSAVERGQVGLGGYSGFLLNSWEPDLQYSYSDFDVRHQMNLNWVADLPFGRTRAIGGDVPSWLNQIIGNWQFAGVFRWTSGFPFNIINSRCCWPTNWNYQGNAELAVAGQFPETVSPAVRNVVGRDADGKFGRPSPFTDPSAVLSQIRYALPGEVGFRNMLRGDGYIGADIGVSKGFELPASHRLRFRWEVFNVTNTPRFNTGAVTMTPDVTSTFGRYDSVLGTCDGRAGRCMQASLKYEF
jgi:Carboxypeptidase regulatory-like domain